MGGGSHFVDDTKKNAVCYEYHTILNVEVLGTLMSF